VFGAALKVEALYHSQPLSPPHSFTDGIEGPACGPDGRLYAVNAARQGTIGAMAPDGNVGVFVELPEGSCGNGIRFHPDGGMLVADYTGHNILRINMASRACSVLAHEPAMHQPNDLAAMKNGIVFASDPDWKNSEGQVWRWTAGRGLECLERGMGTTNGIEVAPGEATLYVNESVQRRIWAYDLAADGSLSRKRLFIEFPDHGLDGMRCDAEGCLYAVRYGKGTVAKLSPAGELLREISLHGSRPSNLAFGGPDGRTVYVTEVDHGRVESFRVEAQGREWKGPA
jgi:gluconolactonase